jgi:hypothetical protein
VVVSGFRWLDGNAGSCGGPPVSEIWGQAAPQSAREIASMPSLIRLLMVVGLLGGVAYGAMFALANFVQPKQREMSITIPQQRLSKPN